MFYNVFVENLVMNINHLVKHSGLVTLCGGDVSAEFTRTHFQPLKFPISVVKDADVRVGAGLL